MPRQKIQKWQTLLSEEQEHSSTSQETLKKWKVKPGQLWGIGKHRILVASSESEEAIKTFQNVDGICTDPPYDMESNQVLDIFEAYSNTAVVLCCDKQAFEIGGGKRWKMRLDFIWVHIHSRSFNSDTQPCFYHSHAVVIAANDKVKTMWRRPRLNFETVWHINSKEFMKQGVGYGKPIELFKEMIAGFKTWKTVFDPFVGTGTTIIAGHRLGKTVFGCEIDCVSVGVALQRCFMYGLEKPRLIKEK